MRDDITDEDIQLLVYRYSIGELTDVQFNFYVQTWQLDREYVKLLQQDVEKAKAIFSQAHVGCLVMLMFFAIGLIFWLMFGIM